MAELVRTNDPALLSAIEGLLAAGQVPHHVADRDMSILDGPSKSSNRGFWCRMSGRRKHAHYWSMPTWANGYVLKKWPDDGLAVLHPPPHVTCPHMTRWARSGSRTLTDAPGASSRPPTSKS